MDTIESEKARKLVASLIAEHQAFIDNLTPLLASIEGKIATDTAEYTQRIETLENQREILLSEKETLTKEKDEAQEALATYMFESKNTDPEMTPIVADQPV